MVLEEALVRRAGPTLAGLKAAELFRYRSALGDPAPEVRRCDRLLAPRGVRVAVLGRSGRSALIYVWRERQLCAILSDPACRQFLTAQGYQEHSPLTQLSQRLKQKASFPHEIGIFLGYPLEDVVGFMAHHGRDYLLSGPWKVYHNEVGARAAFSKFRACTRSLLARYQSGCPLPRLTVSAPPLPALDRESLID